MISFTVFSLVRHSILLLKLTRITFRVHLAHFDVKIFNHSHDRQIYVVPLIILNFTLLKYISLLFLLIQFAIFMCTSKVIKNFRARNLFDSISLQFRNQYDSDVTVWSPQGRLHQVHMPKILPLNCKRLTN